MAKRTEISWEERLLTLAAGGLFVFAGGLKAFDPATFATDIAAYQLLPWIAAAATALYLPWLEIFAGICLMLDWRRAGALRILLLLMLLLLNALVSAWARGLNIECGCFGKAFSSSNYLALLLRDLAIFAALGRLLMLEWKHRVQLENLERIPA